MFRSVSVFVYINDLPSASQFNTTLFADDTLLMLADKNLDILETKVNEQIQRVDYIGFAKINCP